MTYLSNFIRIVQGHQHSEIYNLAGQREVRFSFESPNYAADANGVGTLWLLEAIHILALEQTTPFLPGINFQAPGPVYATKWSTRS
jgi:GDPmannose 4,6-dehydratase